MGSNLRNIRSACASERQDLVCDLLAVARLLDVGDLTPPAVGDAGLRDLGGLDGVVAFDIFGPHYAGNDQCVNSGLAAYETALKENKKTFETFTYADKQHGFHNDTTPRYDADSAKLAWERTLACVKKKLK